MQRFDGRPAWTKLGFGLPHQEALSMGDVVNLNKFRKARDRRTAEDRAAENRARFGQAKDAKAKLRTEAEQTQKDLDGKRLD
jgi:hypothetical protein